jgi:hypothetical protein
MIDNNPCLCRECKRTKNNLVERHLVHPADSLGRSDGRRDILGIFAGVVAWRGVVADSVLVHGRSLAVDGHSATTVDRHAADLGSALPH